MGLNGGRWSGMKEFRTPFLLPTLLMSLFSGGLLRGDQRTE